MEGEFILTWDDGARESHTYQSNDYNNIHAYYEWLVGCNLDNIKLTRADGYLLEFHRG